MVYRNRQDAGRKLAERLRRFKNKDAVVLSLPRGGIVLGAEIAKELKLPLGLILVRKIGHPNYPEYAIGAVVEDEPPVYNQIEVAQIDHQWLKEAENAARELIAKRRDFYYDGDVVPPEIAGRTVIIVDDGIATGLSMQAAVLSMKNRHAKQIIVAVPVSSVESMEMLKKMDVEMLVLDNPHEFRGAVGAHYRQFEQVEDEQVRKILGEVSYELHQAVA